MKARNFIAPLVLPLVATPAWSQVPTVLLRTQGAVPGGDPAEVVKRFFGVAQAPDGGWAAVLDTSTAGGPWIAKIVGDPIGAGAALLHEPGVVGGAVHERLGGGLGIGDGGRVQYEACIEQATSTNCFIEAWEGSTPVLAPSIPGTLLNSFGPDLVRTTADGRPVYTEELGLYVADLSGPLFESGQAISNLADPVPFLFADGIIVSPSGDHFIARAEVDCAACVDVETVLVDGAAIEFAGVPFRSGDPLPASIGTPIDRWRQARRLAVNDAGDWAIEGRILRAPVAPEDEYIARNGEIFLRSGDPIAGGIWVDAHDLFLAGDGRLFHVSSYLDALGDAQQGIFVERTLLHRFGDPVDATGSGQADPGYQLLSYTLLYGQRSFTVSDDGTVLFVAEMRKPNSFVNTALLELAAEGDGVYAGSSCESVPNSTLQTTTLDATDVNLAQRSMTLVAANMPSGQFGFVVTSLDPGFAPNPGGSTGNLCLGGGIGRMVGGLVLNSGPNGTFSVPVNLDTIPSPNAFVSVLPGETRYFQTWHRDLTSAGAATSNLSNGLRLVFP